MERGARRYVTVVARTDEIGRTLPQSIVWENGRTYGIDRILNVENLASRKESRTGTRYHVVIGSRAVFLCYERPRWYMDAGRAGD